MLSGTNRKNNKAATQTNCKALVHLEEPKSLHLILSPCLQEKKPYRPTHAHTHTHTLTHNILEGQKQNSGPASEKANLSREQLGRQEGQER
jgi:hypothetical protein